MRRYTDKEWAEMPTAERVRIRREHIAMKRKAYLGECVLVWIGMVLMLVGGGEW